MVWPGAALDIGHKELVLDVDVVLSLLDRGDQRPLDAELREILTCRPAGTTSHHLSSGSNQNGLMVGCCMDLLRRLCFYDFAKNNRPDN